MGRIDTNELASAGIAEGDLDEPVVMLNLLRSVVISPNRAPSAIAA